MLAKSKKGAIIMGSIVSLTSLVTVVLIQAISRSLSGESGIGIKLFDELAKRGAWGVILIIAVVLVALAWNTGIAAFIIFWLNETHYGRPGAIRWAIFGVIQALVHQSLAPYMSKVDSFIPQKLYGDIVGFLIIALSYGLVFKLLLPVHKKTRVQGAH